MLQSIRRVIANDSHAITFQSTAQYRTALLETIDALLAAPAADYKAMFEDACLDLAAIHTALGIPDDEAGGAAPILAAIADLQKPTASAQQDEREAPYMPLTGAMRLVREKLARFEECAGDDEGCDIGREWFDALTTIGLLARTQRSPARWSMTPAGEVMLAQQVQAGGEDKRDWWNDCHYQTLFNAIAAATNGEAKGIVGVSVIEFRKAMDAALSREQPQPSNGDREGGA